MKIAMIALSFFVGLTAHATCDSVLAEQLKKLEMGTPDHPNSCTNLTTSPSFLGGSSSVYKKAGTAIVFNRGSNRNRLDITYGEDPISGQTLSYGLLYNSDCSGLTEVQIDHGRFFTADNCKETLETAKNKRFPSAEEANRFGADLKICSFFKNQFEKKSNAGIQPTNVGTGGSNKGNN